jgi:hypothetical protein
MVAVMLSAGVTLVIYFTSGFSLDKLEPQFATRAVQAMGALQPAEAIPQGMLPAVADSAPLEASLAGLSDRDYLRVVTNRDQQLRLHIVNPTIHALNILQIFVAVFVAMVAIIAVLLAAHATHVFGRDGLPDLSSALSAGTWAIVFFSAYPICYRIQRTALEGATGSMPTVMQDVLVLILVILMMVALKIADPANREPTIKALFAYAPLVVVATGYVGEILSPQMLNRLIGTESNTGVQVILAAILVLASGLVSALVWPRG